MKPDGGYTRQYRRLWEHEAFRNKQEAAVFSWMKDAAQWRTTTVRTEFGNLSLEVGEVLISERQVAADFCMHRNTLRRLMQRMIELNLIERRKGKNVPNAGTIVLIVKYAEYQGVADCHGDAEDQPQGQPGTNLGPTTKEKDLEERRKESPLPPTPPAAAPGGVSDKGRVGEPKVRKTRASPNGLDKRTVDAGFSEFYEAFPKKTEKIAARSKYGIALRIAGREELLEGAKRYAILREGQDPRYTQNPAAWLTKGRWMDENLQEPLRDVPTGPPPNIRDIYPDYEEPETLH